MNITKSRTKIDLAKTLGRQYADMVRDTEKDELRQEGARDALKYAVKAVGDLGLKLDKALEDGELTRDMLKDPKQVEIFIKRWNKRAVGAIDNLATTAEVARFRAAGKVRGLKAAEAVVEKMARTEIERLTELQRQIDAGEITLEDIGNREAPLSLKHQREDEEKAAAEAESELESEPKKVRPRKKPTPRKKAASKKG